MDGYCCEHWWSKLKDQGEAAHCDQARDSLHGLKLGGEHKVERMRWRGRETGAAHARLLDLPRAWPPLQQTSPQQQPF